MSKTALSAWKDALTILLGSFRQILIIHLIYVILGTIIFTPLIGIIGQGLLNLSGQSALSDFDILYFSLTPLGMLSGIVFTALLISIIIFEQASMMVISGSYISGHHAGVIEPLSFTLARIKTIFILALQFVARLLIIVLPFLAASGAIGWLLLTDYDINYYLSEKPPAFWFAVVSIGGVLLVMAVLLIRRLVDWLLTLPLVLFDAVSAGQSFSSSAMLVQRRRSELLVLFGGWAVIVTMSNIFLLFCVEVLGSQLAPLFYDSISMLVVVLGGLAALFFLGNFFMTAVMAGSFSCLLVNLGKQHDLQYDPGKQQTDRRGSFVNLTAPRLISILAGTIIISLFLGVELMEGIQVRDTVAIIAHRGAAGRAPENTIAAVRAAIEDGADWIEIDVQESSDGEIVVIHDSDLMKLAGVNRKIWDMSLMELKRVDIGSWFGEEFSTERIPTLGEVLEEVRGKALLLIELKYYGHDQHLEQGVVEVVEQAGMVEGVAFMSLKREGIEKLQKLRPEWRAGLLLSKTIGSLSSLEMDFIAVNMGTAGPGFIRKAHAGGKELFVWTVNDQVSMTRMMSLGVDGVITDEPKMARQVLADRLELNSIERLLLYAAVLFDQPIPSKEYRDQSP